MWFASTGLGCVVHHVAGQLLAAYDPKSDPDLHARVADRVVTLPDRFARARHPGCVVRVRVVLERGAARSGGKGYPVDLYLEGSDQHRGWFQSRSCRRWASTGQAPVQDDPDARVHGRQGRQEAQQEPRATASRTCSTDYGADVLRWWVCSIAYENDVKVDEEFFANAGQSYRKVRNTLRFMLSNLGDYQHDGRHARSPGDFTRSVGTGLSSTRWPQGPRGASSGTTSARGAHGCCTTSATATLSSEYLWRPSRTASIATRPAPNAAAAPRRASGN
jgi:hypothetical protein